MDTPLPSADAEAIQREFLSPGTSAPRPLDLDPDAQKDLLESQPAETVQREETPLDPVLGTAAPNEQNFAAWLMETSDIGEVEVEQHEKAVFLKAALNDEQVEFEITLPVGDTTMSVGCRTLNTAEMSLMFAALNEDEKDGMFRDPAQYISAMQSYAITMQVTSVNGKPRTYFTTNDATDVQRLREAARVLGTTNHVRWHYMLLALRIFTIKIKLCTDAALNRDFWQTAGTD